MVKKNYEFISISTTFNCFVTLCFDYWSVWWILRQWIQTSFSFERFCRNYSRPWRFRCKIKFKYSINDTIFPFSFCKDRFDCQILMALFTNVYMTTFMSPVSPYNLVQQVLALSPENREQFLQLLNDYLKKLT